MPWDWVKLALVLVQISNAIIQWVKDRQQFNAGHDAAVREAGEKLLAQSAEGKKIVESLSGVRGSDLDVLLAGLEDKPGGGG